MAGPIDDLFSGREAFGRTDALLVVRGDDVVVGRYGEGIDAATTLRSWSMAKSVLHAAVGMLVAEGELHLDAPAPVPLWNAPGDARRAITLRHLLTMRSGLAWVEDPIDGSDQLDATDVAAMLYGNDGRPVPDTAAFAADRPLVHEPGEVMAYSSGTSAIVAGIVADVVGRGAAYEEWLRRRLFDPLGMLSATPRFDETGTWLGSSYCFCTAPDFIRFGRFYRDGGRVGDERLLQRDWVATASIETGRDADGLVHTMHWWRFGPPTWGAFFASGFRGQYLIVVPALDLVVLRLGETATEQHLHVRAALTDLITSFEH